MDDNFSSFIFSYFKNLRVVFVLIFVLFQSCGFKSTLLVEDRSIFKPIFNNKPYVLAQKIEEPLNILSTVNVSNDFGVRSFEQILIVKGDYYRSSWYAPNFINLLATLVGEKSNWLYCDSINFKCSSSNSDYEQVSILGQLLQLKGFDIKNFMLGQPFYLSDFNDLKVFSNLNGNYIIEAKEGNLVLEFLITENNKNSSRIDKFFATKNNERLLEVNYLYDNLEQIIPEDITPKNITPKNITVVLPNDSVTFHFSIKSSNIIKSKLPEDVFNLSVPKGFVLD